MAKSNTKPTKSPRISRRNVYLDYASATPIDSRVSSIADKISKKYFANPSAIHGEGIEAKKVIEKARADVASVFGAHADEIIFTSGATESNNLALSGILKKFTKFIPHIITTKIEHASVLEVSKHLEITGQAEVTYVEVESNGIVDPRKIKKAMKNNTVLVSVMYANNEIGTIQPIREIAKEIRHFNKANNTKVYLHTDATQAINYLPINIEKLGVDMLSCNAAKIYGPKGVGMLFRKRNTPLESVLYGGDQEFTLRPGTENVVSAVGLAESLKFVEKIKEKEIKRLTIFRDLLIKELSKITIVKNISINGDLVDRLPNNINITIPNIPSDLLVIELSARGISASAKSACKSGDGKASHVIKAIHPDAKDTDGSLRFSLGQHTKKSGVVYTIKALKEIFTKLAPWYQ